VYYNHGFEQIKIDNMEVHEDSIYTVVKQQTLFSNHSPLLFSHSLSNMRQVANLSGDCEDI